MRRLIAFSAVLVISSLVIPVIAQEDPPTLARGYSLKVKLGGEAKFEAAMKKQVEWYKQNNETWAWHMWQWETGDQVGEYLFRSPGHRWEDMDERDERGARAGAHFREVVAPHVESLGSTIGNVLPKVSHWPADLETIPFVSVDTFYLNYGMEEDFEHMMANIHKAVGDSGWPVKYALGVTVSGGEAGTYWVVIPHQNWADMKGPEKPFWTMIEETIGRQEADVMRAGFRDCVREQHTALARFRPDLSYIPSEE